MHKSLCFHCQLLLWQIESETIMEETCWYLLFLGTLSRNLVTVAAQQLQDQTFSTYIFPPDVTTTGITLAPNESFTVTYSIRYTEEYVYRLYYELNGNVIHRSSNYEREPLNYFASRDTDCCSLPGERCRELHVTVNGVEFNHNKTINLAVYNYDLRRVASSDDIRIEIAVPSTSILPSSTLETSVPTPTSVVESHGNIQGTSSSQSVPLCSPPTSSMNNMVNPNEDPATLRPEWPHYVAAGSLLVALVTVTAVLIGTYCLLR